MSRARVRLLITDANHEKFMFTDQEIDTFLAMESQNVYGAAALACLAIAADKAKLGKFTLEGFADNEAAAAGLFLKLSAEYRKQATTMADEPGWAIVEWR